MSKMLIGVLLIIGFITIPSLESDTLNRFDSGCLQVNNHVPQNQNTLY